MKITCNTKIIVVFRHRYFLSEILQVAADYRGLTQVSSHAATWKA